MSERASVTSDVDLNGSVAISVALNVHINANVVPMVLLELKVSGFYEHRY
jgi:hypothetical protein